MNRIIHTALHYRDSYLEKYGRLFGDEMIETLTSTTSEGDMITFAGIGEFNLQYMGKYYLKEKVWVWAWNIPEIESKKSKIARDLFNYGATRENGKYGDDDNLIKKMLTTSRITMESEFDYDVFISTISYFSHFYLIELYSVSRGDKRSGVITVIAIPDIKLSEGDDGIKLVYTDPAKKTTVQTNGLPKPF